MRRSTERASTRRATRVDARRPNAGDRRRHAALALPLPLPARRRATASRPGDASMTTGVAPRARRPQRIARSSSHPYRDAPMRRLESNARVRSAGSLQSAVGLRSRAWLGVAALLLQLALPFLHSLEIRLASAEASPLGADAHSPSRALDPTPGARGISAVPVAAHDEQNCPICAALSHAHAATTDAARVPAAFESRPLVVSTERKTPPFRDVASPDARAPPSASRIAIS